MEHTIRLSQLLQERIDQRGINLSAVVEEDLQRYYALLDMAGDELKGRFSYLEVTLLTDALRNTSMDIKRLKSWPTLLVWDIEDVEKHERLGKTLGVDVTELIEKLETLTPLQALWIWDRVSLFWRGPALKEKKEEAVIKKLFSVDSES